MVSHGESVAQAPGLQWRGSVGGASVKMITTAVGRLLADYVVQLREDIQSIGMTGDVPSNAGCGVEEGSVVKVEDGGSGFAADSAAATHHMAGSRRTIDTADEAVPLTEADVAEFRQRLQRLQRVKHLLVHFSARTDRRRAHTGVAEVSRLSSGSLATADPEEDDACGVSCETLRQNPVLMIALRRFDRIVQCFQGTAAPPVAVVQGQGGGLHEAGTHASVSETRNVCCIQPLLILVPLAEGVLHAFSHNVNIVYRRRPNAAATSAAGKRPRDEASDSAASFSVSTAVAPDPLNYWNLLATQQRKRRFALYTSRSALLPRVNAVCAPLYVSPAVQELAQLNSEAERFMLRRAWCVHTKAHLLREVPWVARDVAAYRVALREALQSFTESQQDAFLSGVVYVEFVCAEDGIVRVCVQHGLFLDLTYDVRRRQWVLIELHWNLFTTSAGASLVTSKTALAVPHAQAPPVPPAAPTTAALAPSIAHGSVHVPAESTSPLSDASTPASFVQVVPHDREALRNFLKVAFAQDGLSGGLHAANRLVCAVVLDTFATQLRSLQESFFTGGGLGTLLEAEVRPGTQISLHISLPELFVSSAPVAHVKMTMVGGTVLLECVRGTDLSTRQVTLPLSTSSLVVSASPGTSTAARGPLMPMVDMEAFLWKCVCAFAPP
ncbi:conserved hypothetical protein [Leishmania braziliensis MHOM/BR/75/M2904]|uniref:Mediator of RNA polymerase II transcription subunit 17 n=2 Tax=Leishmania braziliensis TaxID=5660 RepID=A4HKP1_LEIBR|nr:conserved hypothetical protein [Leishmania braziliensis MHOM/BR/75/M2904]CAJ2478732.1 unnamed protein product [Leishmania braziliensis]CAM43069.2 conserved hypothetical protein [Leishmania braziliensis MHOM/BR/75/M2904]SYZ68775.1 hypothetical_protein [Leishmania braziliensis MHOM/BR/75/M2904]